MYLFMCIIITMDELTLHNTHCLEVAKFILETQDHDLLQSYERNLDIGPVLKYSALHIIDDDRDHIEYAPILIDKNFTHLYTNTGFLQISSGTYPIINKMDVIEKYNLKIYNNKYYFIDKSWSHNCLSNHYRKKQIKDNWDSIRNSTPPISLEITNVY